MHKALYGEIDSHFTQCWFKINTSEAILYTKTSGYARILIVSIYVDDIVYTRNYHELIAGFKSDMISKYEMTDLGLLHHFLGIGVIQTENHIFLNQKKYATFLLKKLGQQDCKFVSIPLVPSDKLRNDDASGAADEAQYRMC